MTTMVHTRADLRAAMHTYAGELGVVMTMGALHDGHRELIRVARRRCEVTVVTVFLNPLQFAAGEDLSRYPQTLESDMVICTDEGVDVVFAPSVAEVYPLGEHPQVRVQAGPLGNVLEGASRPGHFDGVLTVVAKLLHLTGPDVAYFGQKDAQQLLLIRRMVQDLDFPVEVLAVPTVRDSDGLALSSRNGYLTEGDRSAALALSRSLAAGVGAAVEGPAAVRRAALAVLDAHPDVGLDYLALVEPATLLDVPADFFGTALLAVAAKVGTTRLIDNAVLEIGGAPVPVS
ncbi:MAG: pantoate--beta-alanine ligase [Spirochaetaceae bacterium]|nr:pantoate--beta-alanine ligase [Spirochaetaceae bacterium]